MDLTDEELEPAARALYEHAAPGVGPYGERKDWGDEDWKPEVRQSWFDGARAVAEALPQPVVDREAVEVEVCKVIADFFRDDESFTSYHATSLTARLLPLLAPRSLLDREAVAKALRSLTCWRDPQDEVERYVDELVALARPMPTRDQIAAALDPTACNARKDDASYENRRKLALSDADAVLALLTGSAK